MYTKKEIKMLLDRIIKDADSFSYHHKNKGLRDCLSYLKKLHSMNRQDRYNDLDNKKKQSILNTKFGIDDYNRSNYIHFLFIPYEEIPLHIIVKDLCPLFGSILRWRLYINK